MKPHESSNLIEAQEAVHAQRKKVGNLLKRLQSRVTDRLDIAPVSSPGPYGAVFEGLALGFYLGNLALSISGDREDDTP